MKGDMQPLVSTSNGFWSGKASLSVSLSL